MEEPYKQCLNCAHFCSYYRMYYEEDPQFQESELVGECDLKDPFHPGVLDALEEVCDKWEEDI